MVDATLLDLPQGQEVGISNTLEAVDTMTNGLIDLIKTVAQLAEQLLAVTRQAWQTMCWQGMRGDVKKVHEARDLFLDIVNRRIKLIRKGLRSARGADAMRNGDEQDKHRSLERALEEILGQMEAFKSSVFSRWQTQEDLEDVLVEMYPLSNAQLAEIQNKQPAFPAQWYSEDSKPF